MQRLVLAVLFVAAIVAIGTVLARGAARMLERSDRSLPVARGAPMQRVAFLLLLGLMVYASMIGAS